jgi:hypothetical protein
MLSPMPRGYMEGPAAEEAERRAEELARGPQPATPPERQAVYGSSEDDPEPHFLGWADEVDADALFASGDAWGISLRRVPDVDA